MPWGGSIALHRRAACIIGFMRTLALVSFALAVSACGSGSKVVDPVVARVGQVTIGTRELQARLPELARLFRSQFVAGSSDIDKRAFLLKVLLKDEAVLQEARRRGYEQDPAVRSVMIDRVLQDEVEASNKSVDLPNSDIERYYLDHRDEFSRPEQVRILQVVNRDRAVAEMVAAQARAAEPHDIDGFQRLVFKYSEDRTSRARGGDIGFIDRKSTRFPAAVVGAAFALRGLFEVSDPVESERGFHVLKLVQRLPAFTPSLAEAEPDIRAKLRRLLVERKKSALAGTLLQRAEVDIDYAVLVKVPLPAL